MSKKNPSSVILLDDGAGVEMQLSNANDIGFQNLYSPGVGGAWLTTSYMTLVAHVSSNTPGFLINILQSHGDILFAIQTIINIRPEFYCFIKPYSTWPALKGSLKVKSIYRSTVVLHLRIYLEDNTSIIESYIKMINVNIITRKAKAIPSEIICRFRAFVQAHHQPFPDTSKFIRMDLDESENYFNSLLDNRTNIITFLVDVTINESDEDWNGHMSSAVYVRHCGDCLHRAIAENKTFKKHFGSNSAHLQTPMLISSYLKECKALDKLTVVSSLDTKKPDRIYFDMFRNENGLHQLVFTSEVIISQLSAKL